MSTLPASLPGGASASPPPEPAPNRPRRDFSRDECLRAWHAYHLAVTGGRPPTSDWLALVSRIPRPTSHRRCVKMGLPLSQKRRGREKKVPFAPALSQNETTGPAAPRPGCGAGEEAVLQ